MPAEAARLAEIRCEGKALAALRPDRQMPTMPQRADPQGDLAASRTPLAGFTAMGAIWGALAAMLPDLRAAIGASDAQLGAVFLFASTVGICGMLIAPRVGRLLGARALLLTTAAMIAAILLPGQAGAVWAFALCLAVVAFSSAVVDVLMNGRVAATEASRGRPLMNLNHAGYSLSFFAGAILTGVARDAGVSPAAAFTGLAVILAPLLLLTREGGTETASSPAPAQPVAFGRALWVVTGLGGGLILFASVLEAGTEAWSALHLERTLGAGPALGALGPAMLGLCMGMGRLAGQWLSLRMPPQRMLRGAAGIAAAGAGLAAAAPTPWVALAGLAALGLGASVMIPTALTMIGTAATPAQRTALIARSYALGFLGYICGPAAMGLISQVAGLRWSFAMLALAALATLILLPGLLRRARR